MFSIKAKATPSFWEAFFIALTVILIISISIGKLGATPHIPILFSIILLIFYGLIKRVSFKVLEESMLSIAALNMLVKAPTDSVNIHLNKHIKKQSPFAALLFARLSL